MIIYHVHILLKIYKHNQNKFRLGTQDLIIEITRLYHSAINKNIMRICLHYKTHT